MAGSRAGSSALPQAWHRQGEEAAALGKTGSSTPGPQGFSSLVLSSIRLRNGHCRVGGYQPMALWPQFPPCHAGGHGASNLPFLPTLSSCCRTWLFPYSVRMGPKEVNKAGGAHPNPCPHTHRSPHSQPTPAAGAEVPAGPCYLGWPCSGPSCLRCGACVDQSSGPWSLHVHGFMSIPRGAIGAVLAPCHAFGFSSTWCGAGVDPVVALMSPEILDRSAPGPGWGPLSLTLACLPAGMFTEILWDGACSPELAHQGTPGNTQCPQAADSAFLHAGLLGRAASTRSQRAAEQEGAHVCTRAGAWAVSSFCREK